MQVAPVASTGKGEEEEDIESQKQEILFFFGHRFGPYACFSQFFRSPFVDSDTGIDYWCAEQYMMHQKAVLFDDVQTAEKILRTSGNPLEVKRLGRKVKNFDESTWAARREEIVFRGNLFKFKQNAELLRILRQTGTAEICEASPYDRIWGIGFSADCALVEKNRPHWGKNLLGKILMKVRHQLCVQ